MKPSLNVLEDELIARILAEAKRILSEIGVEVRGPALRQRLLAHGLKLQGDRILFPPDVIDKAIASTPRRFTLYDRNGRYLPFRRCQQGGDGRRQRNHVRRR